MSELTHTGDIATDSGWFGRTPHGHGLVMNVRPGTSDWNTVNACNGSNNEYSIPAGLTGWALDIGAHIGAATIPLLLDNPELRVIAVEALPENVLLLSENAALNGVDGRLTILHGAATNRDLNQGPSVPVGLLMTGHTVFVGYSPDAEHRNIGSGMDASRKDGVWVQPITLARCLQVAGADFAWAKIDCEGCEYAFLDAQPELLRQLHFITGEVHFGWTRLVELLDATHIVSGAGQDFGPFQAVVRTSPLRMDA